MSLAAQRLVGSQFLNQGSNRVPCIACWILNPWTTREVPEAHILIHKVSARQEEKTAWNKRKRASGPRQTQVHINSNNLSCVSTIITLGESSGRDHLVPNPALEKQSCFF